VLSQGVGFIEMSTPSGKRGECYEGEVVRRTAGKGACRSRRAVAGDHPEFEEETEARARGWSSTDTPGRSREMIGAVFRTRVRHRRHRQRRTSSRGSRRADIREQGHTQDPGAGDWGVKRPTALAGIERPEGPRRERTLWNLGLLQAHGPAWATSYPEIRSADVGPRFAAKMPGKNPPSSRPNRWARGGWNLPIREAKIAGRSPRRGYHHIPATRTKPPPGRTRSTIQKEDLGRAVQEVFADRSASVAATETWLPWLCPDGMELATFTAKITARLCHTEDVRKGLGGLGGNRRQWTTWCWASGRWRCGARAEKNER